MNNRRRIWKLLYRVVTLGDYWNIERPMGKGPSGGGGQTYLDVPLGGGVSLKEFGEFFDIGPLPEDRSQWSAIIVQAGVIGPLGTAPEQPLTFDQRAFNRRYRITNQNRHRPNSHRHLAWSKGNGFPIAPDDITSKDDLRIPDLSRLKVIVGKTVGGEYFAGFFDEDVIPSTLPSGLGLEVLFRPNAQLVSHRRSVGVLVFETSVGGKSDDARLELVQDESSGYSQLASSLVTDAQFAGVKVQAAVVEAEAAEAKADAFDANDDADARERILRAIVTRRGQPAFRKALLDAYGGKCAITGCDAPEALEAAHILPYRGQQTNHSWNGILLRSDVHTLFDLKLITIDSGTWTVVISHSLRGTAYESLEGGKVRLPADASLRPGKDVVDKHRGESGL